jgi:NAD-dependent deacetylase sirtuin 5
MLISGFVRTRYPPAQVYPAAKYASQVQLHGGKVAVFNLERSEGDSDADYLFLGPCEKMLPEALSLEL